MRQEGVNLRRPHLERVTFIVEEDEAANPLDVSIFGAQTVVPHATGLTDSIEQPSLA
jgi:hypothetical protein